MALALTLSLMFLLFIVANINLAGANFIPVKPKVPSPHPPIVSILSPENKTYNSRKVTLNFSVTFSLKDDVKVLEWNAAVGNWTPRTLQQPKDWAEITRVSYYLDGVEYNITVPVKVEYLGSYYLDGKWYNETKIIPLSTFNWSVTLEELSEGSHTIKVCAYGRYAATVLVVYVGIDGTVDLAPSYQDISYSPEVLGSSEVTFTINENPINNPNAASFLSHLLMFITLTSVILVGVCMLAYLIKFKRVRKPASESEK